MTYVQSKSNTGSGTSIAFALTAAVTVHNCLVAAVFWGSGTATCSVSDPTNGTWTPAPGGPQYGVGGLAGVGFQMFYMLNAGAGSYTITATISASVTFVGLAVTEEAGTATTSFDQMAYLATTGTSSSTCAAITPSQANAFLVCAFVVSNTGFTLSGYTLREEANWGTNALGDIQLTTAVSSSATLALAGDTNQLTGNISFVPTGVTPSFIAPRPLVVGTQAVKARTRFQPKAHLARALLGSATIPPIVTRPVVISQAKYASPYYRRPTKSHVPKSLIGAATAQPIVTRPIIVNTVAKNYRQPLVFRAHLAPALKGVVTSPPLPPAIVIQQAGFAAALITRLRVKSQTTKPIVTTFGVPVDKTPLVIGQAIKRPYVRLYPPHLAKPLLQTTGLPPVKTTPTILSQALQRALIGRSKPAVILPKPLVQSLPAPVASRPYTLLQAVQRGTYTRNRPFPAHLAKGVILAVAPPPGVDRVAKIISQALQRAVLTRSRPLHPLLPPPIINPPLPPPPITFTSLGHRIRHQPYPGWPNVD